MKKQQRVILLVLLLVINITALGMILSDATEHGIVPLAVIVVTALLAIPLTKSK